jgi:hypothetical protein
MHFGCNHSRRSTSYEQSTGIRTGESEADLSGVPLTPAEATRADLEHVSLQWRLIQKVSL